jgi:hypothetical protein
MMMGNLNKEYGMLFAIVTIIAAYIGIEGSNRY